MRHLVFALLIVVTAVPCLYPQALRNTNPDAGGISQSGPLVAAAAAADRIRFTALALTRNIRVEIISATGETVYDSGNQPGNRLEWQLREAQSSNLPDGVYGCLVTVTDLEGATSHRRSVFSVSEGAARFPGVPAGEEQSPSGAESLTILGADRVSPLTVASHDGSEGWIESGAGGLSLHSGSLSRDPDSIPHFRLTPEGRVGIGVREPRARLDVAGLIRTSEGIEFADGTVLAVQGGLDVLRTDASHGRGSGSTAAAGGAASRFAPSQADRGAVRVLATGEGGGRVYGTEAENDIFYGMGAGTSTTADFNAFFGSNAGHSNTTGAANSLVGHRAGILNTTGWVKPFVGAYAGESNTSACRNSFFGAQSGQANTAGTDNTFAGSQAGAQNTTGSNNSFFGAGAG